MNKKTSIQITLSVRFYRYNVVDCFAFIAFCRNVNYDLEMAFYKYLDTRLEKSTLDFLYEYMTENRQYVLWLKDVEKFLEE